METLPLGQIPAPRQIEDVIWPVGSVHPSVLSPAEKGDGWLLADGRRFLKTVYPELAAALGHKFEVTPNVDPGDGRFRIPPLVERSASADPHDPGSAARVPLGDGPSTVVGQVGGALGHRHPAGSLALDSHAHSAAGLSVASHAHGHNLGASHAHALHNDSQPVQRSGQTFLDSVINAGGYNPPFWLTTTVNPGVGGGIGGSGTLGVGGATAAAAGGGVLGSTGPEDPAYVTTYWYVKT